jgi:hypothetical protein
VSHVETYVKGRVHTNGLENFWSLLKRNLAGTYVAEEPFHLDRYLDEQKFQRVKWLSIWVQTSFYDEKCSWGTRNTPFIISGFLTQI